VQEQYTYREAQISDIPQLAKLHSEAWRETYAVLNPPLNFSYPTAELREYQWREIFKHYDGSWFCIVVENSKGELIGFAKGQKYNHSDLPDFDGELNKIYLLRRYHKEGIGLRLLAEVVRRFDAMNIYSMVLFSEPANPTGKFFEAVGGQKIYAKNGEFHGGYGWADLKQLADSIKNGI
jgi:RimJ/RimL family protein N-acetyltransferase